MSIPEVKAFLGHLMTNNATTALAAAVAWLDPLNIHGALVDMHMNPMLYALSICHDCFEDTYPKAVKAFVTGRPESEIEALIMAAIEKHLVYFDDGMTIEDLHIGIPTRPIGVDWYGESGETFEDEHEALVPVFTLLGGKFDEHGNPVNDDHVCKVALILSNHLLANYSDETPHHDVATLLRWMFNDTGNGLADCSYVYIYENGVAYFPWTPDQIEYVNEMQREAFDIHNAALRALWLLEESSAWYAAMHYNAEMIGECLTHHTFEDLLKLTKGTKPNAKKKANGIRLSIYWPGRSDGGNPGTTQVAA